MADGGLDSRIHSTPEGAPGAVQLIPKEQQLATFTHLEKSSLTVNGLTGAV